MIFTRTLLASLTLLPLVACGSTQKSLGPYPPGFVAPFQNADLNDPRQPLTLALPEVDLWGGAPKVQSGRKASKNPTFPVRLTLRTGERIEGRLIEADDERALVLMQGDDTRAIRLTEMTPGSHYTTRRLLINANDAEAQMQLGAFALDIERWQQAAHHFKIASNGRGQFRTRAAASLALLRDAAAGDEITRAQDFLDDGNATQARRICVRVLRELPEETAAGRAALLVARIDQDRIARRTDSRIQREAEVTRQLSKATDLYDKAQSSERDGFANTQNATMCARKFTEALAYADDAADEIDRIQGRHDMTPELRRAAQRLQAQIDDLRVEQHVHLACMDLVRSAFDDAEGHVSAGIGVMEDQRLTQVRNRIRVARDDAHWHRWYLAGDGPAAAASR
tara:strand:+ start:11039 stop:12226 length:1188 start_codon:yes stop_codon:yes gene_type:complete